MPRAPNPKKEEARALYEKGLKLIEIAEQLNIPEGTVRSWKNRGKWNATLQTSKCNVAKRKRGGQPGNKNAVGAGGTGPPGNRHAEKYGFFSKFLPQETKEIFDAVEQADPIDLLWHQIQIAYAAIIRAQKIMHVKDIEDKTTTRVEEKNGKVSGERWEIQQAWDKQASFLKAQARAQGELRSLIKQYDEMIHKNWEMATEEQKIRIESLRMKLGGSGSREEEVADVLRGLVDDLNE